MIAVLVNVGLLAVLLVAALTTQEELPAHTPMAREEPLVLPKFEEITLYQELPVVAKVDPPNEVEPIEPLVHKLPPLVSESTPVEPILASKLDEVIVKKGDSLEKIAKSTHTTVDELIKLNHLPSSFLKIGQVLKIPAERILENKSLEKKSVSTAAEYYTIKVGENPWAIAIRHHMKLEELLKLNGLNEEKARKLKPGDRLRIR